MAGVTLRARQFIATLWPRQDLACAVLARGVLSTSLLAHFETMDLCDQIHACQVQSRLAASGWDDEIASTAALLHDAGKSCGGFRASAADRVALVLARRLAPGWLERARGQRAGLDAAANHPAIGARCLRNAGAAPYAVWLVANHDRRDILDDPLLTALIAADDAPPG